jgi:hypothetical protein
VTIIYSRKVNQLTVINKECLIMKFIQVSILCLASFVVMSGAKAATQDRVPAGSAAIWYRKFNATFGVAQLG